MKSILERLINLLLVMLVLIASFAHIESWWSMSLKHFLTGAAFFLVAIVGFIGGLNYVLFGKFRLWNKATTGAKD